MKQLLKIFYICLVLFAIKVAAQSNSENYVQTRKYLEPVTSSSTSAKQNNIVQYYDGLGRAKQVVAVKASPQENDVVTNIEYDYGGRQTKNYLPLPQAGTSAGQIYSNPLGNVSNVYGAEKIYSEKKLDNSPFDILLQEIHEGNDWASKSVKYLYELNNGTDAVKKLSVTTSWNNGITSGSPIVNGNYASGVLYKTTKIDEDGNRSVIFKNTKGLKILDRKITSGSNVDTYFVYNEYDQLVYIFPPILSRLSTWTSTDLDHLAYQYFYDGKNRVVATKFPGKSIEYTVYDLQDRPVAKQNSRLAKDNRWLVTKYDAFGRVAFKGLYQGGTRSQEQTKANSAGKNNVVRTNTVGFSKDGMDVYYTDQGTYPEVSADNLISITYYDNYAPYVFNPTFPATIFVNSTLTDAANAPVNTRGLALMSFVKNLEDQSWTKKYQYYDNNGKVIGNHIINHLGGYTSVQAQLTFTGLPMQVVTKHKRLPTDNERIISENFEYDAQERLKKHWHKVDNLQQELLTENNYDEKSQLVQRKAGNNIQTINYAYNIRGWLLQVNNPSNLGNNVFGYRIRYQNPESTSTSVAKFDGTISEVSWKTSNDGILRRYSYRYDEMNRLLKGIYSEPNSSVVENGYFNEEVTYDLNSNIKSLVRFAKPISGTTAEKIDDLIYNYQNKGRSNLLDLVSLPSGVVNNPSGYNAALNNFNYDNEGNVIKMMDKGKSTILYNYLNLPTLYDGDGYDSVNFTYTAEGNKVKKVEHIAFGNISTQTDYLDSFQYENGLLKFVSTPYGYFDYSSQRYIYNYTDHLGNVRVSYAKQANGSGIDIIEESNYYPLGLKHVGYNSGTSNSSYNYKFNGKEYQPLLGSYDYGARFYMPDLGRWGVVDPLADKTSGFSPYLYALGNPVNIIDPDGMEGMGWGLTKEGIWEFVKNMQDGDAAFIQGGYTAFAADGSTISNASVNGGPFGAVYLGYGPNDVGYSESNYTNWYALHGSEYRSSLEAYRAWRDTPGYHKGEGFWDKMFRSMNSTHMEVLLDEGSGGSLMYGGFGRAAKTAEAAEQANKALTDAELIDRIAQKAQRAIPGSDRFAGKAKHRYAEKLLTRYQDMFGDRGFKTEFYFNNNKKFGVGNRGILDVVNDNTKMIYDYKFGEAGMGSKQFNKYSRNFPGYTIEVINKK